MKMQLKENVEFRNLTVNCNTFKEKVSELVEQFGGKVAYVFKSPKKVFANTILKAILPMMEFA